MKHLSKIYIPQDFEQKCYQFWIKKNFFQAFPDSKKSAYTIVMPPPNITAQLHMGHALNNTLQDILIRWKRMQGYNVLYQPGTDHAGIATQNVLEKSLHKEGKSRDNFSRKDFVEKLWKWKKKYGSVIIDQLKRLGCSCDWNRERFTMDEGLSIAVREVFVRLYENKLIYKGKYIVNWCPHCVTALSNEEVNYKSNKGFLYYINYAIKDTSDFITIATTRPETILGDGAVAVNPKDFRYQKYIGKILIVPLVDRLIPVIADELVESNFGTGAVKVTGAHDSKDFIIAKRHNIPFYSVITPDGKMNNNAKSYCGLDRFECRVKIIENLEKNGFLLKKELYENQITHCYRCDSIIEPYLSDQWFVKMKPLAKIAKKAALTNKIKFYPEKWKKVYLHWMENIEDWCISRQIWWGHRIPVWICEECNYFMVLRKDPKNCSQCHSIAIKQDNDVLDTWFSSMLWPLSTMGWPDETADLNYFYPTNVLSTAPEILFFWVARMIMAGLYFKGEVPYSEIYLHSTVRDKFGRKMSKSLGNGIDPLEVIEKHGADALRFSIINLSPMGQDIKLSFDQKNNDFIHGARFANKIWNASRYILMSFNNCDMQNIFRLQLNLADQWILDRLQNTIKLITKALSEYRFNEFSKIIYEFFWNDFCDWYIELSKLDLYSDFSSRKLKAKSVLVYVLMDSLKLLHPIMPFITEEIWQKFPQKEESIVISTFPKKNIELMNTQAFEKMSLIQDLLYHIRNIRAEVNINPSKKINIIIQSSHKQTLDCFDKHKSYISHLSKIQNISFTDNYKKNLIHATAFGKEFQIFIPLEGVINLVQEKARLKQQINKLDQELLKINHKLQNNNFLKKANFQIVEKEKEKHNKIKNNLKKLKIILSQLN